MIPMGIVVYYSFQTRGPWGTTIFEFSLESYRQIFDPLFLKIVGRSFKLAALTVAICLAAGYLIAYWIAFYGGRRKNLLLFLVILPFWTSYLVRIYAWMTLLSDHGLINTFLMDWGLIDQPLPLLHNEYSVLVGLVYTYLPFMILPLYASLERLDRSVLEATADLGATPRERLFKITVPLTKGGILSGSVLVFAPAIGEFLIKGQYLATHFDCCALIDPTFDDHHHARHAKPSNDAQHEPGDRVDKQNVGQYCDRHDRSKSGEGANVTNSGNDAYRK